ncbi:MAG: peptidylprolyl isomerase [Bacillota bacterium]
MKRFRTHWLLLVVLAMLLTACTAKPATQTTPPTTEPVTLGKGAVAMVNGKPVTDQEFAQRLKVYELFYSQDLGDAQTKNTLLDRYINEVLLLEEAGKRGIKGVDQEAAGQVAQFNTMLANRSGGADKLTELKKNKNLVDADIQKALGATLVIERLGEQLSSGIKVTDADIQSYYTQNLATQFTIKDQQIRARHILVGPNDEAKAKEILARIKKGEDFAKLATELSIDTGSGARGGDLGYFGKGAMVKPFEDAAFALKNINDLSEPVKSDFGWHIIQLTGRRAPGALPLTEVKSAIETQLKSEKTDAEIEKLVKDLRAKATVEVAEFK